MKRFTIAAALAATIAFPVSAGEDRVLEFPENYRDTFTLYFSGDRYLADEQTIRIYANDIAVNGARKDGKMPDGSVFLAEIYAAQKDADGDVIESAIGQRLQGEFKAIALMERRAGWDDQYADELKVGDWEFEVFSTEGKNLAKDTTSCRECHHPLADSEFMFSIEHLVAAAK